MIWNMNTKYSTSTEHSNECMWWQYPILIATIGAFKNMNSRRGGGTNSNLQETIHSFMNLLKNPTWVTIHSKDKLQLSLYYLYFGTSWFKQHDRLRILKLVHSSVLARYWGPQTWCLRHGFFEDKYNFFFNVYSWFILQYID